MAPKREIDLLGLYLKTLELIRSFLFDLMLFFGAAALGGIVVQFAETLYEVLYKAF